ncbi:MAG: (4Fe-4S)-binding protein [Bacteroidetes bacterium]|nr:(4Fe-4S)-binding protein [Bacteroidota bacterium]
MEKIKKKYSNGEVTIIWEPDLCDHSAICFRSLPNVFIPSKRPWIDPKGATTEEIIKTVKRCPTRALKFELIENIAETKTDNTTSITILKDGPYLIDGSFKVLDNDGNEVICEDSIALCRCGSSKKKPFCDGAHNFSGFKD